MNKTTVSIIVVVFAFFLGLVFWSTSNRSSVDYASYDFMSIIGPNDDNGQIGDHVRGNPDAELRLVEWADFSCSHCAGIQPMMTRIIDDYGDRIAFINRNFPLSGYPNSIAAASIVEAAGLQGFYNVVADSMFANQALWVSASETSRMDIFINNIILPVAPDINVDQLKEDMKGQNVAAKINFDKNLGKLRDIKGTPTIYFDGERLDGTTFGEEEAFRKFLDEKLAALDKE